MKLIVRNLGGYSLSMRGGKGTRFSAWGDGGRIDITVYSPEIIWIEYRFDAISMDHLFHEAHRFLASGIEGFESADPPLVSVKEDDEAYTITVRENNEVRISLEKTHGLISVFREEKLVHGGVMGTGDTVIPAYPARCVAENRNALPVCRFNFPLERDDSFYGLGDKSGNLDRRGRCFKMHNRDSLGYDASNSDPLYKSVPFLIKRSRGRGAICGLFFPAAMIGDVDLGRESPYYYSVEISGGPFGYYLYTGRNYGKLIESYCSVSGFPALPPLFSFGFFGSSMNYAEPDDAEERIFAYFSTIEHYRIPCEGMYLSSGYLKSPDGKRYAFLWNTKKFPDYELFLRSLADRGYNLCVNIKPGILTSHPWYRELAEKGYFIQDENGEPYTEFFWGGEASFVDFENPEAKAWWKSELGKRYLDHGCTGIWNDNNELELEDSGLRAFRTKSIYPVKMAEAAFEAFKEQRPEIRPWVYSRSGYSGIQRYARTWTGDNVSDWCTLKYNQWMGLSLGLSGIPFYGHDIGGFFGDFPEEELLLRSCQSAVFQPRFVIHSWKEDGRPTEPWSYPGSLETIRNFIREHYRFMPYTYNCAIEASERGTPIERPLFFEFPGDRGIEDGDINSMYGPSILKVLAAEKGVSKVRARLPEGNRWYAPHEGKAYAGGSNLEVDIPLDEYRWFARVGSVIPTSPGLEKLSTAVFPLVDFLLFPSSGAEYVSYRYREDDGKTELSLGKWNEWSVETERDPRGTGSLRLSLGKLGISWEHDRIFRFTLPFGFRFADGSSSLEVTLKPDETLKEWRWIFTGSYEGILDI